MIIERRRRSVAEWYFEDPQKTTPTNWAALRRLLEMSQLAAEVLERHELLCTPTVTLRGWMRADHATGTRVRTEEPDLIMTPVAPSADVPGLWDRIEHELRGLEQARGFLYPVGILVLGVGVTFDAEGKRQEFSNVCWFTGGTLHYHYLCIRTQSDAWLPCTLKAEPQLEIYNRNAPRLEAALQEVQARLGIEEEAGSESDYVKVNGYRLTNRTYADGEVVDVI